MSTANDLHLELVPEGHEHERLNAEKRAYYRRNRDRLLAEKRRYTAAHAEENRARAAAWRKANPERAKARAVKYHARVRERHREQKLLRAYGITLADRAALLAKQGGRCGICWHPFGTGRSAVHVDHEHDTGRVRGLLCGRCNSGLGFFLDSEDRLLFAMSYLRRTGTLRQTCA